MFSWHKEMYYTSKNTALLRFRSFFAFLPVLDSSGPLVKCKI